MEDDRKNKNFQGQKIKHPNMRKLQKEESSRLFEKDNIKKNVFFYYVSSCTPGQIKTNDIWSRSYKYETYGHQKEVLGENELSLLNTIEDDREQKNFQTQKLKNSSIRKLQKEKRDDCLKKNVPK